MQEQRGWVALAQEAHEVTAQLSPGITVMARSVRAKPLSQAHSQGCLQAPWSSYMDLSTRMCTVWQLVTPEGEDSNERTGKAECIILQCIHQSGILSVLPHRLAMLTFKMLVLFQQNHF